MPEETSKFSKLAGCLVNTCNGRCTDIGLLLLRVCLGSFMLTHGWQKLSSFAETAQKFPDPLGLGSQTSLALAVFAEFFCSIALILGLATRLALIPLMTTMVVAGFIVTRPGGFGKMEMALLYLAGSVALMLAGPGRISLDGLLARKLAGASDAPKA